MTDITAFATGHPIMHNNGPTFTFTASGAITAGMVVAIDASGDSDTVRAAVAESGESPIGVALITVADGEKVTVALPGAVVYMVNADDTTAIDAGSYVETNDCAVGGTVTAVSEAASGGATATSHYLVIGKAIDDIAGGSYGRVIISYSPSTQANTS
jgi:alpha-L-arabinofuranosidase